MAATPRLVTLAPRALQARPLVERLGRCEIGGSGDASLERFLVWRRLVRVLAALDAWAWSARLHRAFASPGEQALRVEL